MQLQRSCGLLGCQNQIDFPVYMSHNVQSVPISAIQKEPKMDTVIASRIIVYTGSREWIKKTFSKSIQGKMDCGNGNTIEARELLPIAEELVNKARGENKE